MPKRVTPPAIVSSSQSADSKDSAVVPGWRDDVQSTTEGQGFDRVLASKHGHHSAWACPSIKTAFMSRTASFLEWLRWRFIQRNWAHEDKDVLIGFVKDMLDLAEVDLFQAHYKMQLNFDANNRIRVHCRYHSNDDELSSDLYDDWDAVLFRDATGGSDIGGDDERDDASAGHSGDSTPKVGAVGPQCQVSTAAQMRRLEELPVVPGSWLASHDKSSSGADPRDEEHSASSPPGSPSPSQRPRPRPFVRFREADGENQPGGMAPSVQASSGQSSRTPAAEKVQERRRSDRPSPSSRRDSPSPDGVPFPLPSRSGPHSARSPLDSVHAPQTAHRVRKRKEPTHAGPPSKDPSVESLEYGTPPLKVARRVRRCSPPSAIE